MSSIKKLSVLALTLAATSAFAGPVVSYTTFGSLPAANFGGSGIPNDAVAITTIGTATLGLSATGRNANPPTTNNGAGTFHATGGLDNGDNNARWNFDFYVDGGSTNYTYRLFADFNAAVGNADTSYTDISGYLSQADSLLTAGTIQNSENFGFGTTLAQFNPSGAGEYGVILVAYDNSTGVALEVGRSAILIDVPEPASLALVGVALLGMAGTLRRRSRR